MVLPTPFAYLQFPWRLLGLAGWLATLAVTLMTAELGRASRAAIVVLALAATLGAALPVGHRRVPTNAEWSSAEVIAIGRGSYGRLGYTILGEYLPRGEPADSVNARIQHAAHAPGLAWRAAGDGWVADAQVEDSSGVVVLPLVAYDLYRVVDEQGREVATETAGGLLAVRLDRGRHQLRVARRRTGVELAGIGVSLAGVLAFAALRRR
jgi:hypothetical protein